LGFSKQRLQVQTIVNVANRQIDKQFCSLAQFSRDVVSQNYWPQARKIVYLPVLGKQRNVNPSNIERRKRRKRFIVDNVSGLSEVHVSLDLTACDFDLCRPAANMNCMAH